MKALPWIQANLTERRQLPKIKASMEEQHLLLRLLDENAK
jgi:hypothetical protein